MARTAKTCRQCANHISYIPRCPSFSWVSSADTQDFGGWLVNILTSCITRDFRAHLSFEIRQVGPTSDEPTLGLPHDQICWAGPSALLPQTSSKLSPDGDLQCRIAAGVASTHVSWLRRMCPGFDACAPASTPPTFASSPRVILLTTPLGWLTWRSMGTA